MKERRLDSLNGFVVFVQVAETRSFVAAGRLLGISASAIGKSVARLEARLGVRLFHRSTRSITLTAEGTLFLERSRRILAEIEAIAQRRGLRYSTELAMKAAAAPSAPEWQQRWEAAVDALGVPLYRMPSGAGHDAMKLHEIMPQAMLFVRGLNAGISHNPLESSTADDMQLSVDAFSHVLNQLAQEQQ